MKSPQQLSKKLAAQWQMAEYREQRLIESFDWPIRLSIGLPDAQVFQKYQPEVLQHLSHWRDQKIGKIEWRSKKFQSATEAVDMPAYWLIGSPSEWATACAEPSIKTEFEDLSHIVSQVDEIFHPLLVRHRSLCLNNDADVVIQCCQLAMQLQPGMAQGRPLRALTVGGIDSKFMERNRSLLTKLLDKRFAGGLRYSNLEIFLGASEKNGHWLLVVPLAKALLPFEQLRLRTSELAQVDLKAHTLIIVENEQCLHQLPQLNDTIAILGAGLDLNWLKNTNFNCKRLIYWGDLDTWGLKMLACARNHQQHLSPILMDDKTFEQYKNLTVSEPKHAGDSIPEGLTNHEANLYQRLKRSVKGRLEQEFIDGSVVKNAIFEILNQ